VALTTTPNTFQLIKYNLLNIRAMAQSSKDLNQLNLLKLIKINRINRKAD
jgi:hypothetical protein